MLNKRPHITAPQSLWRQTPKDKKNPPPLDAEMAGKATWKNLVKTQVLSPMVARIGGEVK